MSLVALQHVGNSQIRDRNHVPCIGRWILNHWTTKEVLIYVLKKKIYNQAKAAVLLLLKLQVRKS